MIEDLRLRNLQKQVGQINTNRQKNSSKAIYQERDPVTGTRKIQTALGGFVFVNFLSNSQPKELLDSYNPLAKTALQKPALPKDRPL